MSLRNLYISSLFVLILSLCVGCTHNNGDIGPFFGKWKMQRMTINGVDDASYKCNVFWSFQSSTIGFIRVVSDTRYNDTFGNWAVDDAYTTMRLSFPDEIFPPFSELQLERESELEIVKIKGPEMILKFITKDSDEIVYYLEKW